MKVKWLIISFIFVFMGSSAIVFAQLGTNFPQFPFQTWYSPDALATFLGVPSDWLILPKVIYYVIIPFVVAVAVTYGILTELNIFRNSPARGKINKFLAIAMAFLLLPSGILTQIVNYLYLGGTFVGLVGFGFLFIVGVVFWVYGTTYRFYNTYGTPASMTRDIRGVNNRINNLHKRYLILQQQQLNPNLNQQQRFNNSQELGRINTQIAELQARRTAMQAALKDAGNTA